MSNGSRIFVAESFLTPSSIVWRVASGPGWATAGGQPDRRHGVMDLTSWGSEPNAITWEASRALFHSAAVLRRWALQLGDVQALPVGEMD